MAQDGAGPDVQNTPQPADLKADQTSGRRSEPAQGRVRRRAGVGLSTQLLLLTALFVMLAEVLIFVPSIANFRVNWLNDRLMAARLSTLASVGTVDGSVPDSMRMALLSLMQVKAVAVKQDNQRRMILPPDTTLVVDEDYDVRRQPNQNMAEAVWTRLRLIYDALATCLTTRERIIRVIGRPDTDMDSAIAPVEFIEIVFPESTLRKAMLQHGLNILLLSLIISGIAAVMVYLALNRLLVRPILQIADNMLQFSEHPQDQSRIIVPSERTDEVGTTERELMRMQQQLAQTLQQKTRLAQLGLAVSKISHDLRNMLASAQLISDRLATLPDPTVQRFAPKLIASLDRAIGFCNDTVRFGRAEEPAPRREVLPLAGVVSDVADGLALPRETLAFVTEFDDNLLVDADRQQLYRILNNIVRNAVQVLDATTDLTGEIRIVGRREDRSVTIEVRDNGPGLPAKARANLFQAFQGGARVGGTGLGLAIAAELVQAHGGTIRLLEADKGAAFEIIIPDRGAGSI